MPGLRRRADRNSNIWPGFVDALATLLMVIMFLLLIFVLAQFFLSEALSGREQALDKLKVQVTELADLLSLEKKSNDEMRINLSQLSSELQTSVAQRDELRTSVSLLRKNAIDANETISKLEEESRSAFSEMLSLREKSTTDRASISTLSEQSKRDRQLITDLQTKLSEAETRISILQKRSVVAEETISKMEKEADSNKVSLAEAVQASKEHLRKLAELDRQIQLLDALKTEMESKISEMAGTLAESGKSLLSEKEFSESARAEVALLNQQMSALRAQLAQIRTALEISEEDARKKNIQITNLGKRLNSALASKVQELSRYRSEFFGRLRALLGNRQGVRIVGDRFVFQSEVLFAKSEAEIAQAGQAQLDQLATTLLEIALEIPGEIDWILRVDGHTDNDPINTARYPSNWELSTARAISVVKHLVDAGLPANRLVAAGFGEFHPIDKRNDEISKRRNRRIELKLTQR